MKPTLEDLKHDELRKAVREMVGVLTAASGEVAKALYLVYTANHWETWGFQSMVAYAEEELGMSKNRLYSYIVAGRVTVERKLSLRQIRKLGKVKLAQLANVSDDIEFGRALEYAENHSEAQLKKYIKTLNGNGENDQSSAAVHDCSVKILKLKIPSADYQDVVRLMTMVMVEQDYKTNGEAILLALRQYWTTPSGDGTRPRRAQHSGGAGYRTAPVSPPSL